MSQACHDESLIVTDNTSVIVDEYVMDKQNLTPANKARQHLMSVLAQADAKSLLGKWKSLVLDPACNILRGPEVGLISTRGRIGGGGDVFNFGEATVTRASVELTGSGTVGHAVVLGRAPQKAKLAAVIDALAQDETYRTQLQDHLIRPLMEEQKQKDEKRAAETAATKVDFFTLVRGDD